MHFSNNVQDKDSDCKYNYLPITRFNLIAEYKSYVLKLTFFGWSFSSGDFKGSCNQYVAEWISISVI